MKKPIWMLVKGDAPCCACGWDTTDVWHYRNIVTEDHHCTTCHRVGNSWHRNGDSQPVSGNLECAADNF